MVHYKKQTLPPSKMNGNDPIKSLYTMPLFLTKNAPKQNMFSMNSLSSNPIRLGPWTAPYTGPRCGGGCWKSGKTGDRKTETTGIGAMPFFDVLGVVLCIPWLGLFMCPLAVAGLGLRYFRINFLLMFGHSIRNPCRVALRSVEMFGLHNDWCANSTAFACICTECANVAILGCPDDKGVLCGLPTFPSRWRLSSEALGSNVHKSL